MAREPTAAQAIYGHLPSAARPEVEQRQPDIASAMFPGLSREAKQRSRDQQLWDEICRRQRDNFLREWRRERGR
jgi:hypothetical protein